MTALASAGLSKASSQKVASGVRKVKSCGVL